MNRVQINPKVKKLVKKIIEEYSQYCCNLTRAKYTYNEYGFTLVKKGRKREKYAYYHSDKVEIRVTVFILNNHVCITGELVDTENIPYCTLKHTILRDTFL